MRYSEIRNKASKAASRFVGVPDVGDPLLKATILEQTVKEKAAKELSVLTFAFVAYGTAGYAPCPLDIEERARATEVAEQLAEAMGEMPMHVFREHLGDELTKLCVDAMGTQNKLLRIRLDEAPREPNEDWETQKKLLQRGFADLERTVAELQRNAVDRDKSTQAAISIGAIRGGLKGCQSYHINKASDSVCICFKYFKKVDDVPSNILMITLDRDMLKNVLVVYSNIPILKNDELESVFNQLREYSRAFDCDCKSKLGSNEFEGLY
jgi:hypothetical protein